MPRFRPRSGTCDCSRPRGDSPVQRKLEQVLAMDVQYVEATNASINLVTMTAFTRLEGDHRGGFRCRTREMEELVDRPTRLRLRVEPARDQTHLHRLCRSTLHPLLTEPASPPAPRFRRSTARGRSSRSGSAIASCRRAPRPVSSRFSPWWPPISIGLPPTLRIAIGGESIVATGIHRFWKAGKGWTMARELKAGDRFANDRRHGRDRIDRGRQDATRL